MSGVGDTVSSALSGDAFASSDASGSSGSGSGLGKGFGKRKGHGKGKYISFLVCPLEYH